MADLAEPNCSPRHVTPPVGMRWIPGATFRIGDDNAYPVANTWQGPFPYPDEGLDGFLGRSPVGSFPPQWLRFIRHLPYRISLHSPARLISLAGDPIDTSQTPNTKA